MLISIISIKVKPIIKSYTYTSNRRSKLGPSIDHLAIVYLLLARLLKVLIRGALFDNKGSSNQEVADLITNKMAKWSIDGPNLLRLYKKNLWDTFHGYEKFVVINQENANTMGN